MGRISVVIFAPYGALLAGLGPLATTAETALAGEPLITFVLIKT
jgi:hypothetical protein